MLTGRQCMIHAQRDRKLEEAASSAECDGARRTALIALATEPSVNYREVQILAS